MTHPFMWDRLWVGGHLATLDPELDGYGEIRDGALASRKGRIVWVGPEGDLPSPPKECAREVLDLEGGWLTPGLVDCHTHLVFAGDRSGEFEARLKGSSYEEIARAGKLLAFHVGADAFEHTHPFRVAKVARMFPELQILMVHMGGVGHHALTDAAIEIAQEHPNITLIGSKVEAKEILHAIKTLGASRLCFGSDAPFTLMRVEVAKYNALLDGEVSSEEKEQVMGGNIARLFGLNK